MCTHTHVATRPQCYKATNTSANHDHTKWNTTIIQHHKATRQQSLVHMHTWLVGKIKYTKVSLYTYLLGVKDKAASQTCICITCNVQDKPIILYIVSLCICYPLLFIVSVFAMRLSMYQSHKFKPCFAEPSQEVSNKQGFPRLRDVCLLPILGVADVLPYRPIQNGDGNNGRNARKPHEDNGDEDGDKAAG